MDMSLATPSFPVAIADGFIEKEETSIVMQCHDRVFQRVTVLDEAGGEKLFTAESKGIASWSWRRTVKDASGSPLYDLRKTVGKAMRSRWVVEGLSGQEICSLRHVSFRRRQALDVVFRNDNDNDEGNERIVEVRPKDQGALTTLVSIKGVPVAEIQMTEVNTCRNGLDRSVWRARVASGVDLALIVAIMLCRAEIQHVWKE